MARPAAPIRSRLGAPIVPTTWRMKKPPTEKASTSPVVTNGKSRLPWRMSTTCVATVQNATLVRAKTTWNQTANAMAGQRTPGNPRRTRNTTVTPSAKTGLPGSGVEASGGGPDRGTLRWWPWSPRTPACTHRPGRSGVVLQEDRLGRREDEHPGDTQDEGVEEQPAAIPVSSSLEVEDPEDSVTREAGLSGVAWALGCSKGWSYRKKPKRICHADSRFTTSNPQRPSRIIAW